MNSTAFRADEGIVHVGNLIGAHQRSVVGRANRRLVIRMFLVADGTFVGHQPNLIVEVIDLPAKAPVMITFFLSGADCGKSFRNNLAPSLNVFPCQGNIVGSVIHRFFSLQSMRNPSVH